MRNQILKKAIFAFALLNQVMATNAQEEIEPGNISGRMNIISTAVPFLEITPESRGGGMGDTGAASSPDVNSQHWNPAKYAFINKESGVAISYSPWLRKLVNDISLSYLAGFKRLDDMQTISASLKYFSMGEVIFRQTSEDIGTQVKPNEFAIDVAYSRILSEHFSGAVAFRYIRSDLQLGSAAFSGSESYQPGNSFAADLAFYYQNDIEIGRRDSKLSAGINISNIGSKMYYGYEDEQFIPTNLKLGVSVGSQLDEYNKLTLSLDLNKLLVPTPDPTDEGNSDNISVISGIFKSFTDAPGGLEEELQEITISVGAEYLYANQFAIRAGYFHEHENKGNRKYFTAGVGIQFSMLNIDASYIIPVVQNNPLADTIRFTLGVDLDQILND